MERTSQEYFFQCDGKSLKLEKGHMPVHLLSPRHPVPHPAASISWGKEEDEPSHTDPILVSCADGEGRHGRGGKKCVGEAWQKGEGLTWKAERCPSEFQPSVGGRHKPLPPVHVVFGSGVVPCESVKR